MIAASSECRQGRSLATMVSRFDPDRQQALSGLNRRKQRQTRL
jgi:hypothetical protein